MALIDFDKEIELHRKYCEDGQPLLASAQYVKIISAIGQILTSHIVAGRTTDAETVTVKTDEADPDVVRHVAQVLKELNDE